MKTDDHASNTSSRQRSRPAAPAAGIGVERGPGDAPAAGFVQSMRNAWRLRSPVIVEAPAEVRAVLLREYIAMTVRNGRLGLVSFALLLFAVAHEAPLLPRLAGMVLFMALLGWRERLARRLLAGLNSAGPQSGVAHEVLMVAGAMVWGLLPFLLEGSLSPENQSATMYCALVVTAVISVSYTSALPASVLLVIACVVPQVIFLLLFVPSAGYIMALGIVVCGVSLLARVRISHASLLRALTAERQTATLVAELQSLRGALERENVALSTSLRDAHDDARRDALTGIFNRRQLIGFADPFRMRAAERGEDISVCLGDLDSFKAINDQHGHLVGDEILRAIAQLLGQRLREGDCLIRHGGEEFLIVLRCCDINRAFRVAEALRHNVASTDIPTQAGALAVTISLGIAQWTCEENIDDVIARADRAMYQAKLGGRDCVEIDHADMHRLTAARFEATRPAAFV